MSRCVSVFACVPRLVVFYVSACEKFDCERFSVYVRCAVFCSAYRYNTYVHKYICIYTNIYIHHYIYSPDMTPERREHTISAITTEVFV